MNDHPVFSILVRRLGSIDTNAIGDRITLDKSGHVRIFHRGQLVGIVREWILVAATRYIADAPEAK